MTPTKTYYPSPGLVSRFREHAPLFDLSALNPAQADAEVWKPDLRWYCAKLPGGELLYVSNLLFQPLQAGATVIDPDGGAA